jgi:hypothetical protein
VGAYVGGSESRRASTISHDLRGRPQAGLDRYPRRLDGYTISCMDSRLAAHAATQGGVILRRQALDYGFTDQEIASLCRGGVWVRIRRGAFVDGPLWRTMTHEDRHRVTVHAVVLSLDKPAVVSHTSASVLLNLPTWGYDLSHIHVTRADLHSARIEGGVHHHAGSLETGDVISVDGVEVTSLDRTAIQIALMGGFERGVVVADAALRLLGGDQAVRSTDSIGCATGKAHERRAVSSSSLTGGPSRWASHAPGSYSSWRAFRDHNSKN